MEVRGTVGSREFGSGLDISRTFLLWNLPSQIDHSATIAAAAAAAAIATAAAAAATAAAAAAAARLALAACLTPVHFVLILRRRPLAFERLLLLAAVIYERLELGQPLFFGLFLCFCRT